MELTQWLCHHEQAVLAVIFAVWLTSVLCCGAGNKYVVHVVQHKDKKQIIIIVILTVVYKCTET